MSGLWMLSLRFFFGYSTMCIGRELSEPALCGFVGTSEIARFMRLTWGSPGPCRPQMGPTLAPWTLLSRFQCILLEGQVGGEKVASFLCVQWFDFVEKITDRCPNGNLYDFFSDINMLLTWSNVHVFFLHKHVYSVKTISRESYYISIHNLPLYNDYIVTI